MNDKARNIKMHFLTYFDGSYGIDPIGKNVHNTYLMGICKLEYNEKTNTLTVHVRRPGLLIGKGGKILEDVIKYLGVSINIIEVNLYK